MQIDSIRHKALRRFAETGVAKGLPAGSIDRLRDMLAFLDAVGTVDELRIPPNFGAHPLSGDRRGEWSLFLSKNWRMTFGINEAGAIEDMDLEDYH